MFTPERVTLLVLAAITAVALVKALWRGEDKLVQLRTIAAQLSTGLTKFYQTAAANFFAAVSVGDIPKATKEGEWIVRQLANPKTAMAMLGEDWISALPAILADGTLGPQALKGFASYVAANAAAAKAAGLTYSAPVAG